MVLSLEVYRARLGLPEALLSKDIPKHLLDMINLSTPKFLGGPVVVVLGTVETQDLHFLVTSPVEEVTT